MPLFEINNGRLEPREAASFHELHMRERQDLQPMLRDRIEVIDDELLVIAEEFSTWEDSRRRIDLLALRPEGRLVVIELKRTEDGGHMELQALRYAAMVSGMDFAAVVDAYEHFLTARGRDATAARTELLEYLGADDDDPEISSQVDIVLVAADFGSEITTTALWLLDHSGLDIRCVRVVPYVIGDRTVLDVQTLVPLPDAADYQVKIRRKAIANERRRTSGRDYTKYCVTVDEVRSGTLNKRRTMRTVVLALHSRGIPMKDIADVLPSGKVRRLDGEVTSPDEVVARAESADPGFRADRWFVETPIVEGGHTFLMSNQWGRIDGLLDTLSAAFPAAAVRVEAVADVHEDAS